MKIILQVLIFALAVAAASADVLVLPSGVSYAQVLAYPPPAAPAVHIIGALPATPILRALPVTTSRWADEDPLISFIKYTHYRFTETEYIKSSDHYSYAYECYDWKTGITEGLYESRYGETAVGTAYRVTPQHERTTVNYTANVTHGVQASVVSKEVQTQPMFYGYANMAAPLAYDSFHMPKDESTHEAMTNISPYAQKALITHNNVMAHLQLEAPFNLTLGYQVKNIETGHTRSQYETYQKNIDHGRYVEVGVDGSEVSVNFIITDKGFEITTPMKN